MDSWAAQPGTGSRTASSMQLRTKDGNILASSPTRKRGSGTRIATGADVGAIATPARSRRRTRRAPLARTRGVARRLTFGFAAACWTATAGLHQLHHHHLHRRHHRHHHLRFRHHRRHHHRAQKAGGSLAEASTDPQPLTFPVPRFHLTETVRALPSDHH